MASCGTKTGLSKRNVHFWKNLAFNWGKKYFTFMEQQVSESSVYEGVSKSPRTMLITRNSLVVHEFPASVC